MISPEQEKKYLENKGVRCPFCNSDDIECNPPVRNFQASMKEITVDVVCLNQMCEEEWTDRYTLIGAIQYD